MENTINFAYKRQIHSELALARINKFIPNIAERFEADLDEFLIVLPLNAKTSDFDWTIQSISHEYLHLILTELESRLAGQTLDNLGYNLATGYDCREFNSYSAFYANKLEKNVKSGSE